MEIEKLKDLLPLPESIRQRLFQLQIMSLICIFIRKERYLPHIFCNPSAQSGLQHCEHLYYYHYHLHNHHAHSQAFHNGEGGFSKFFDSCKALRGFLLMVTRQGKLLYISDNATDYLGHSVEEIMSQGDSLYELVDLRDHGSVQAELLSGPPSVSMHMRFPDERVFICRMNLSRVARRQLQYQKFIIIHGRYLQPAEFYQALLTLTSPGFFIHPVFAAFCQPLITPENAESLATGNTTVFSSLHQMDMKIHHLGQVNPKRKYNRSISAGRGLNKMGNYPKPMHPSTRNFRHSCSEAPYFAYGTDSLTTDNPGGINIMALNGLTPPNQQHINQIRVEIPHGFHAAPGHSSDSSSATASSSLLSYLSMPSLPTPEISPADSVGNKSLNDSTNATGTAKCSPNEKPAISNQLPEIDSNSLEAFFKQVEAETKLASSADPLIVGGEMKGFHGQPVNSRTRCFSANDNPHLKQLLETGRTSPVVADQVGYIGDDYRRQTDELFGHSHTQVHHTSSFPSLGFGATATADCTIEKSKCGVDSGGCCSGRVQRLNSWAGFPKDNTL